MLIARRAAGGGRRARRAASASACRSPRAAARRRGRHGAARTPRRRARAGGRRSAPRATCGATTKATRRTTPCGSSSSGGIQNAPSTTPSIELRWKSRWPIELRLPAMLIRSFERPRRRNVSASTTSRTSARTVGCGTWPPLTRVSRAVAVEPDAVEGAPLGARGRSPRRHLARFGAAVDLEQRRAEPLLGARRQLRRERRGRADDEVERRQLDLGIEHRPEVERRRHQRARRGDAGQRGGDVGGKERPAGIEDRAAVQREQDARLEAVHVLRRDGRDQADAGDVAAAERAGQAARLGARVADEQVPRLGVRHRVAGRAGRQHVGGDEVGIDDGDRGDGVGRRRAVGVANRRDVVLAGAFLDQRIGACEARAKPRDGVGEVIRRQQAGVPAQQRRAEADGEPVAIGREIEHGARASAGARQARSRRRGTGAATASRRRRSRTARRGRRPRSGRSQSCEPRSA